MSLLLLVLGTALAQDWRLVGAYDASSISTLEGEDAAFVWRPDPDMLDTCGPAKTPDGLGIFEAEAVTSHLMPTLVLVLEPTHMPDDPDAVDLTSRDLRVSLGAPDDENRRVLLQPMVEPRHLAIRIDAPGSLDRFGQLVRTQLEVETCLEHKVGRGWTGQDETRLRQAFLLTPPATQISSRKYFGGQRDPVPALTGPPDACVDGKVKPPSAKGRGEGSMTLVPTDVWGANLRNCDSVALDGGETRDQTTRMPLEAFGADDASKRTPDRWRSLAVTLSSDAEVPTDEDVRIEVRHEGDCLYRGPMYRSVGAEAALEDVLAMVPHHYPVLRTKGAPPRVVLMIPGWQIVEALRQLDETDPNVASAVADLPPVGVQDGVGFLLSHPELLFVQLRPPAAALADDTCPDLLTRDAQGGNWSNIASVMRSATLGQPWGYTVGLLAGRSPIALPQKAPPTWAQMTAAQRGVEQAAFLAGLFILLVVFVTGARRLSDLWTRIPKERAYYWPGVGEAPITPDAEFSSPIEDNP